MKNFIGPAGQQLTLTAPWSSGNRLAKGFALDGNGGLSLVEVTANDWPVWQDTGATSMRATVVLGAGVVSPALAGTDRVLVMIKVPYPAVYSNQGIALTVNSAGTVYYIREGSGVIGSVATVGSFVPGAELTLEGRVMPDGISTAITLLVNGQQVNSKPWIHKNAGIAAATRVALRATGNTLRTSFIAGYDFAEIVLPPADVRAPLLLEVEGRPTGGKTATISVSTDEAGTLWGALCHGSIAPTKEALMAGASVSVAAGSNTEALKFDGLLPSTTYRPFVVVRDEALNISEVTVGAAFDTHHLGVQGQRIVDATAVGAHGPGILHALAGAHPFEYFHITNVAVPAGGFVDMQPNGAFEYSGPAGQIVVSFSRNGVVQPDIVRTIEFVGEGPVDPVSPTPPADGSATLVGISTMLRGVVEAMAAQGVGLTSANLTCNVTLADGSVKVVSLLLDVSAP